MITVLCLFIPFAGTALGACGVLGCRGGSERTRRALTAFAAGVMTAASVWSLLLPAIELSADRGKLSFLPAVIGLAAGTVMFLLFEHLASRVLPKHAASERMTALAVTLHNIPEGMAVGAVLAGLYVHAAGITAASVVSLAVGIAAQNLPEGAIVSMPLAAHGMKRGKACVCGILSGAVEPIAGALTASFAGIFVPSLPYCLGFAAGVMLYAAAFELLPEIADGTRTADVLWCMGGFAAMMALDVLFG